MKSISSLLILCCIACCSQSQTFKYLDKNKVKARINTNNDKFWNINGNGAQSYEVPRGTGRHSSFANSIWIGGLDAGGQLHLAANTYKQSGTDFWPGPLDTSNIAVYSSTASAPYNRVWKIDCDDIHNFVTAYNNGSVTANTYTTSQDIVAYPGKGTFNFQSNFAPFFDANHNGLYDPLVGGDYPIIKGHQQILSVFNDNQNVHTESTGSPMGIEIHERSYAYYEPAIHDTMQAINYTTFYHYTIYNRSNTNYHDVFITDWSDVDLGYYMDDYIGTDSVNNFAYCYNGTATDPNGLGVLGYGNKPPVLSHAILPTDCSNDGIDNDGDQVIDEAGEQFILDRVTYYNNNMNQFNPATTNPGNAIHFYNYMTGKWKDNTDFTFGGNAYGGPRPTEYVYTGDPSINTGWTEFTAGNTPGDRRILFSSGPFNMPAKSKIEWGFALVFSRDTLQPVNTITQFGSRVQRDVKNIRIYDAAHQAPQCAPSVSLNVGLAETRLSMSGMLYPNPVRDLLYIDMNENLAKATVIIYNVLAMEIKRYEIRDTYRFKADLTTFESGIYFAKVQVNGRHQTFKFIKE